jgi:hypothetical protein
VLPGQIGTGLSRHDDDVSDSGDQPGPGSRCSAGPTYALFQVRLASTQPDERERASPAVGRTGQVPSASLVREGPDVLDGPLNDGSAPVARSTVEGLPEQLRQARGGFGLGLPLGSNVGKITVVNRQRMDRGA